MVKAKLAIMMLLLSLSVPSKASYLELALVLDGSGSLSSSEYQLQLNGYKNALTTGSFYTDYVLNSVYDGVYLSAWQFSNSTILEADWTLIDSDATATAFGSLFTTLEMPQLYGGTATDDAIDTVTASLLAEFGADGIDDTMIIDISTDGVPNSQSAALASADNARSAGVTINAIGVGSGIGVSFLEALVADGSGDPYEGFYLTANTFDEFSGALNKKIIAEVTGGSPTPVSEPSTIGIFSMGLLFIGGLLRRSRKSAANS